MSVIVRHNQSLMDIAIQEYGTIEAVFDIAVANEVSITDELTTGQELILPESEHINKEVLDYYIKNNIHPTTWGTPYEEDDLPPDGEGIGFWVIGDDFKVS